MRLVSVEDIRESSEILWTLLSERTPEESISHTHMPSRADHDDFVDQHPYAGWWLIEEEVALPGFIGAAFVGAIYLTDDKEIGIGILKKFRGNGYGQQAVTMLMRMVPDEGPFLANINPHNSTSARMFHKLGFRLLQVTYASQ